MPLTTSEFCTRIVPVFADAAYPKMRSSIIPACAAVETETVAGADVDTGAGCANAAALVPIDALAGPVELDLRSIATVVTASVQPDGGVTETVKYAAGSSCVLVGQPLALIEPAPAEAASAAERAIGDAVTPVAVEVAGVEICEPVSLARFQVASTPENAVQVPGIEPSEPLPLLALPFVHTALPAATAMHV